MNTSPQRFEKTLRFLTAHYRPVSLEDVLTDCEGRGLPSRALLVTFDDAYSSVAEVAAPLCRQFHVPAVFFINAAFLDNQRLAPDNLVCYVANVLGIATINTAIRAVRGDECAPSYFSLRSVRHLFAGAIVGGTGSFSCGSA